MEKILAKLTSGRFLLTLIAGGVFAYVSINGILEAQAISTVIAMVFISYFQKKENGNGN